MPKSIVPDTSALWHSPGRFCAVVSYTRSPGAAVEVVRARVASLMRFFDQPRERKRARFVVALSPATLAGLEKFVDQSDQAFPAAPGQSAYVRTPADVVLQLGSDSEVGLRRALRVVSESLTAPENGQSPLSFTREVLGARIFNGEEPFGFHEGVPNQGFVRDILGAVEAPGAWLLFQVYKQNVREFFAAKATAVGRQTVLGRAPHALPVDETDGGAAREAALQDRAEARAAAGAPAANSHWARMRQGAPLALARRGFPCRTNGSEALAFVAVAATVEPIRAALSHMQGPNGPDALLTFVEPVDGNVYFSPVDPDWLSPGSVAIQTPVSAKQLDRVVATSDYLVVPSFLTYLMELRFRGLFDDRDRPSRISDAARPALDALYAALGALNPDVAAGRVQISGVVDELRALEEQTLADAKALNDETEEYVSFG